MSSSPGTLVPEHAPRRAIRSGSEDIAIMRGKVASGQPKSRADQERARIAVGPACRAEPTNSRTGAEIEADDGGEERLPLRHLERLFQGRVDEEQHHD